MRPVVNRIIHQTKFNYSKHKQVQLIQHKHYSTTNLSPLKMLTQIELDYYISVLSTKVLIKRKPQNILLIMRIIRI